MVSSANISSGTAPGADAVGRADIPDRLCYVLDAGRIHGPLVHQHGYGVTEDPPAGAGYEDRDQDRDPRICLGVSSSDRHQATQHGKRS